MHYGFIPEIQLINNLFAIQNMFCSKCDADWIMFSINTRGCCLCLCNVSQNMFYSFHKNI